MARSKVCDPRGDEQEQSDDAQRDVGKLRRREDVEQLVALGLMTCSYSLIMGLTL